jgi:hypothetical protein
MHRPEFPHIKRLSMTAGSFLAEKDWSLGATYLDSESNPPPNQDEGNCEGNSGQGNIDHGLDPEGP